MAFLAPDLVACHQARRFQHSEVLHHPLAAHLREMTRQFSQGLTIALEEAVEEQPAVRVTECREDLVPVHSSDDR
jgi:hypothetical protein